jgi:hypothetical protein
MSQYPAKQVQDYHSSDEFEVWRKKGEISGRQLHRVPTKEYVEAMGITGSGDCDWCPEVITETNDNYTLVRTEYPDGEFKIQLRYTLTCDDTYQVELLPQEDTLVYFNNAIDILLENDTSTLISQVKDSSITFLDELPLADCRYELIIYYYNTRLSGLETRTFEYTIPEGTELTDKNEVLINIADVITTTSDFQADVDESDIRLQWLQDESGNEDSAATKIYNAYCNVIQTTTAISDTYTISINSDLATIIPNYKLIVTYDDATTDEFIIPTSAFDWYVSGPGTPALTPGDTYSITISYEKIADEVVSMVAAPIFNFRSSGTGVTISVGDIYTNNGSQFTIESITYDEDDEVFYIQTERTFGVYAGTNNPLTSGTLTFVSGDAGSDATVTYSSVQRPTIDDLYKDLVSKLSEKVTAEIDNDDLILNDGTATITNVSVTGTGILSSNKLSNTDAVTYLTDNYDNNTTNYYLKKESSTVIILKGCTKNITNITPVDDGEFAIGTTTGVSFPVTVNAITYDVIDTPDPFIINSRWVINKYYTNLTSLSANRLRAQSEKGEYYIAAEKDNDDTTLYGIEGTFKTIDMNNEAVTFTYTGSVDDSGDCSDLVEVDRLLTITGFKTNQV